MPSVSVIMNVRNGASTLREALESVLAQSFHDWELIIWDDRSTDDSARIIAEYKDPRIRYFLSPDETSLGKARSNAIRQATGEWLAFLDQDDIWLPDKLQKQMALADDGVGLIYGRTVRFYPSGLERDYDQAPRIQAPARRRHLQPALYRFLFHRHELGYVSPCGDRSHWRHTRGDPNHPRLLAVCRHRAAVSGPCCAGSGLPLSRARLPTCRGYPHWPMNHEVLWLIDQWAPDLDPRIVARCRKRHFTAIAVQEMRKPATAARGLARLFTQGSVASQLTRPLMFAFHIIRRNVRRPYWRSIDSRHLDAPKPGDSVRADSPKS